MSTNGPRAGWVLSSIAAICVLSGAVSAFATALGPDTAEPVVPVEQTSSAVDIAGRWQGTSYEITSDAVVDCNGNGCNLVLDIARCASGWCGVEVADGSTCGATALRLDQGADDDNGSTLFKGKLELAHGTEPYVVEAYLLPAQGGDTQTTIEIAGDTGGEFRMFRRTFPFNAQLVRAGDATCKPETSLSMLDLSETR